MKRITQAAATQQAHTTFFETVTSPSVTPKTFELAPTCLSIMVISGSQVPRVISGDWDALWKGLCSTPAKQRVFLMARPIFESLQDAYDQVKSIPTTAVLELNTTREDALAALREGRFSEIIIRAEKFIEIKNIKCSLDKFDFIPGKAASLPAPTLPDAASEALLSSSARPQEENNQLQTKTSTLTKDVLSGCALL